MSVVVVVAIAASGAMSLLYEEVDGSVLADHDRHARRIQRLDV